MGKMKRLWVWLQEQEKSVKKELYMDMFTNNKHDKKKGKKDETVL